MNQLHIEALHDSFGARVTGAALSGDLSDSDPAPIREAIEPLCVVRDYVCSRSLIAPVDANHAASARRYRRQ